MYGNKIKYYRLKNNMTLDELAYKLSCTKAAISQYENDKRDPDESTIKKLADAFNISWIKLMPNINNKLSFQHFSFRKKTSAKRNDIELLKQDIESKCQERIDVMSILDILPNKPFKAKRLDINKSTYENSLIIRKEIGVALKGPIYSITDTLETLGIIMLTFNCPDEIEGLNGLVNNIPYIFFNSNRTIERQRFTIIHELCHLFFNNSNLSIDDNELEKYINNLTGNVLISDDDIENEFGDIISMSIYLRDAMSRKYKISPLCLMKRLLECRVINETYYKNYFKIMNSSNLKKKDITLLDNSDSELPKAFTNQVYRALTNELISSSRASELLNISLYEVINNQKSIL